MLTRTVYEALPVSYVALGGSTLFLLEQSLALISASIVFWLGAKVYNMRSNNRRTDSKRKRKSGYIPESVYSLLPFAYLFGAILLFRSDAKGAGIVLALILLSYSLYILIRRSSYRQHKLPTFDQII